MSRLFSLSCVTATVVSYGNNTAIVNADGKIESLSRTISATPPEIRKDVLDDFKDELDKLRKGEAKRKANGGKYGDGNDRGMKAYEYTNEKDIAKIAIYKDRLADGPDAYKHQKPHEWWNGSIFLRTPDALRFMSEDLKPSFIDKNRVKIQAYVEASDVGKFEQECRSLQTAEWHDNAGVKRTGGQPVYFYHGSGRGRWLAREVATGKTKMRVAETGMVGSGLYMASNFYTAYHFGCLVDYGHGPGLKREKMRLTQEGKSQEDIDDGVRAWSKARKKAQEKDCGVMRFLACLTPENTFPFGIKLKLDAQIGGKVITPKAAEKFEVSFQKTPFLEKESQPKSMLQESAPPVTKIFWARENEPPLKKNFAEVRILYLQSGGIPIKNSKNRFPMKNGQKHGKKHYPENGKVEVPVVNNGKVRYENQTVVLEDILLSQDEFKKSEASFSHSLGYAIHPAGEWVAFKPEKLTLQALITWQPGDKDSYLPKGQRTVPKVNYNYPIRQEGKVAASSDEAAMPVDPKVNPPTPSTEVTPIPIDLKADTKAGIKKEKKKCSGSC